MNHTDILNLSVVLEKKIKEGIVKLEKADMTTSAYDKILTNIITSSAILDKITFVPETKPKQETKTKPEKVKEN